MAGKRKGGPTTLKKLRWAGSQKEKGRRQHALVNSKSAKSVQICGLELPIAPPQRQRQAKLDVSGFFSYERIIFSTGAG
jgi:hypothetical protein